jgi:hypothetical protein
LTLIILAEYCYAECRLCLVSFMLIVTNKTLMLNTIMANIIMLSVVMLIIRGSKKSFGLSIFDLSIERKKYKKKFVGFSPLAYIINMSRS